jgi:hypothetical protein
MAEKISRPLARDSRTPSRVVRPSTSLASRPSRFDETNARDALPDVAIAGKRLATRQG